MSLEGCKDWTQDCCRVSTILRIITTRLTYCILSPTNGERVICSRIVDGKVYERATHLRHAAKYAKLSQLSPANNSFLAILSLTILILTPISLPALQIQPIYRYWPCCGFRITLLGTWIRIPDPTLYCTSEWVRIRLLLWCGLGSAFHFDPDTNPDPAPYQSNANPRPLVYRHSTAPFWTSTVYSLWFLTLMRTRILFNIDADLMYIPFF